MANKIGDLGFSDFSTGDRTMQTRLAGIVGKLQRFRSCGPSDDPDEQTSVVESYRYLVTHLKYLSRGVVPSHISEHLASIDPKNFESVYDVYNAKAEIDVVLPEILEAAFDPRPDEPSPGSYFVSPSIIDRLASARGGSFDAKKLTGYCRELNSSYYHGNIVACLLLVRTILNHVPPLFGQSNFDQVAASVSRSHKETFAHLQSGLRKLADLYAHKPIRQHEEYPTRLQIDPYKAQVEVLLQEVLCRLEEDRNRQTGSRG
jgi:hypothetical protein